MEHPDRLAIYDQADTESAPRRTGIGLRCANLILKKVMQEYLEAATYFNSIGAQTSCKSYGGSRSMIYYQMLNEATTLTELRQARARYAACHEPTANPHDELGGILRIIGYRLRNVPVINDWFEAKVRQDDRPMAHAQFDYPPEYVRYTSPPASLIRQAEAQTEEELVPAVVIS